MKRLASIASLAALFFVVFVNAATGQTLYPIVAEFGHKAAGSFNIQSNALLPMAVTIEAQSFSLDKSGKHVRPLDPTTHVQLSETSARLGPKEIHEFSYKIKCDVLPCEVSFLSAMIIGHTKGDTDHPTIQVRLILDHAVYVCEKPKDCRKTIIEASGYRGPVAPSPAKVTETKSAEIRP